MLTASDIHSRGIAMSLTRRIFVSAAALSPLAANSAFSQTRQWPNRPVRIIIPYAPGGPVEIPGRFIAEHLTQRLGQPVIVETRPGAGGALGTKHVIAAQDDHTFLMITGAVAIQPAVQPDIGYDPLIDLLPVSLVSESSMCFAVRPNAQFQDLRGLIAAAKANPGKITYGTSGNGTTTHMAPALFGIRAGISWQHVPYRGAGQLISGFLAGDVDVMSADVALMLPHIREGRANVLGVTAPERSAILPEVPSITEVAPGTGIMIWFGICAARNMPEANIARFVSELEPLRSGSVLGQRMAASGSTLLLAGPQELAERLRHELPLWRQVVAEAGIKPD
jgi:tripartite-type tricarboxylate transporter receptor subunit TctC